MRNTYVNQLGEVKHRSLKDQVGFAQMWHVITLDKNLSDKAYRAYALLLKYAQQKDNAYVTVGRMADDLGKSKRAVYNALKELVDKGLVTREGRKGTSSITWIEEISEVYRDELRKMIPLKKSSPPPEEIFTQITIT